MKHEQILISSLRSNWLPLNLGWDYGITHVNPKLIKTMTHQTLFTKRFKLTAAVTIAAAVALIPALLPSQGQARGVLMVNGFINDTYLHAFNGNDQTGNLTLSGQAGDPASASAVRGVAITPNG